jgi:alpha-beta hydrolase superfamily lysophospholipase
VISRETAVSFSCANHRLYGIIHQPLEPSAVGLIMLPGKPALRSGRHRLFVLLARRWAEAGFSVMRFDYRGAGDCEGHIGTLDESHADISSAMDAFQSYEPRLQNVVLWGLCGGAADAVLYAPQDPRISGVALVNPWFYDARVRSLVKLHRGGTALLSKVWEWTGKAASPAAQGGDPGSVLIEDSGSGDLDQHSAGETTDSQSLGTTAVDRAYNSYRVAGLSSRLAQNLQTFQGKILLILSGRDPGARAFKRMASISLRWRRLLSQRRVRTHELPDANHSLRRPEWRQQASAWTLNWLRELSNAST